jgi:hypothetical protein
MIYGKDQLLEAVFAFLPYYKRIHEDGFTFDLGQAVRDATLEWLLSEYTEIGVVREESNPHGKVLIAALHDLKTIGYIVCTTEGDSK